MPLLGHASLATAVGKVIYNSVLLRAWVGRRGFCSARSRLLDSTHDIHYSATMVVSATTTSSAEHDLGSSGLTGRHLDRYRSQTEAKSWSKLFGRKRTYRNLYGRVSGYGGADLADALEKDPAPRPGEQRITVGGGSSRFSDPLGEDALEVGLLLPFHDAVKTLPLL